MTLIATCVSPCELGQDSWNAPASYMRPARQRKRSSAQRSPSSPRRHSSSLSLERYPIKLHRNRMRRSSSCTLAA